MARTFRLATIGFTSGSIQFHDNGEFSDTITVGAYGDFEEAGILPGVPFTITDSAFNDGTYTPQSVEAKTITLIPSDSLVAEVPVQYSNDSISFYENEPPVHDCITDSDGGFIDAGFQGGMKVAVSGSKYNNATFTIYSIEAGKIEIPFEEGLVYEPSENWITMIKIPVTVSGNLVDLSALASTSPIMSVDMGEVRNIALDGTMRIHSMYQKIRHELTVNNVSSADADKINGWKVAGTELTYTPDTDDPSTTYQVKIINEGHPLNWMPGVPTTVFEGTLMLREV